MGPVTVTSHGMYTYSFAFLTDHPCTALHCMESKRAEVVRMETRTALSL
jgi:hypothetical protein